MSVTLDERISAIISNGKSWTASEIHGIIKVFEPETAITLEDIENSLEHMIETNLVVDEIRYRIVGTEKQIVNISESIHEVIAQLQNIADVAAATSTGVAADVVPAVEEAAGAAGAAGAAEGGRKIAVASETQAGIVYTVDIGAHTCTCPDYQHRSKIDPGHVCKHMKTIVQNPVEFDVAIAEIAQIAALIAQK